MARILIVCDSVPSDQADGLHLRVHNLVAELTKQHECYLLYCDSEGRVPDYDGLRFYTEIATIPPRPVDGRSWKRHFRFSNANFLRLASPAYLASIDARISELVADWQVDLVASFAAGLGEVGDNLSIPRVLDYTDSRTLTLERMLANPHSDIPLTTRLQRRLELTRVKGRERSLVRRHNFTTTISGMDRAALLRVSGVSGDRVRVIPNGVSNAAIEAGAGTPATAGRSVAFWGNLDFPPNRTAIRYFFHQIFMPFLADGGVEWHIAGRLNDAGLRQELEHPQIRFHGFVDDLFDFVRQHGVMVNPMVEGSGLKNKILEAFALGIPVVSTPLGIEAIDCEAGKHYLPGPDSEAFAGSVLKLLDDATLRSAMSHDARQLVQTRYSWDAVGNDYCNFLNSVLAATDGAHTKPEPAGELRYESR